MRQPFEGARSTLNVLFNIEIFLGVAISTVTTFYLLRINAFFGSKEQKILLGHLLHFYVFGLIVILINVANIQLWKRLWDLQTLNPHAILILNLWLCFNTFIFLCGLSTLWCFGQCASETVTVAETALLVGIDRYYEFPEWKMRWDELQIKQQCCGVACFDDWQTAEWLPKQNSITPNNFEARAPYSCCRKNDSKCYKIHAPGAEGSMPILPLDFINTNGCLPIFRRYLEYLINLLWGILLIGLFFQLCIWFLVCFIMSNQSSDAGQDFSCIDDYENQEDPEVLYDC